MNFPKPEIDRDAALQLWIAERSEYAKEQLVLNSTGLIMLVMKRLNFEYDEDIFDIGMLGLIKAINTFDSSREVAFSTYACTKIKFAIVDSFRGKKTHPTVSLDAPVVLENGEQIPLSESVADKNRFEEEIIAREWIRAFTDELSSQERQVVNMAAKDMSQVEIAMALGVTRGRISQILAKLRKKWKLKDKGQLA